VSAAAVVEQQPVAGVPDDDVTHLVCCDKDRAFCGEDVSTHDWRNRPDSECCPLCLAQRQAAWDAGRCCAIARAVW
jgi:hypothetical protein